MVRSLLANGVWEEESGREVPVRIDFRWVVELSTPVLYTTVASLDPVPRLVEKKKHDLVV